MGLRYILGGAGTGKTALMLDEMTRFLKTPDTGTERARRDAALIYIVPEQFTLQSERALCLRAGGAVMNAQVLSFQRFAYRLFAESGGGKGVFLDDPAKRMLLRKLIHDLEKGEPANANPANIFAHAADRQGFLENLSHTFTEFLLCGVTAESLRYAARAGGGGGRTFGNKLESVCEIYERYVEALNGIYITAETALDLIPGKVLESGFLEGARVWIDGFVSFTAKEYKIIESLLIKAESVSAAFTIGSPAVSYAQIDEYDKYREVKTAINTITRLADLCGVSVESPRFLEHNYRFDGRGRLLHLERYFLGNRPKPYRGDDSGGGGTVNVYAAEDIYDEAERAARRIHALVRGGFRYGDIAVVCGDVRGYERPLSNALRDYGIPFFIDIKRDVLSHPLIELIRSAVDVIAQNRSYEAVFRFLKTGLAADGLGIPRAAVDMLENYVLEYGLSGYKWDIPEWRYGEGEAADDNYYDYDAVNDCKRRVCACFARFLKPGGKGYIPRASVRQYASLIFELLEALNVPELLDSRAARFLEEGDFASASASEQIYGKVCRLFERMDDILGGIEYDVQSFAKILQAGFSAVDMGDIPHTLDQLTIGDAERSRFPDIKALFVLGANEGVLPFYGEDAGVFTRDERLGLIAGGVELPPGGDMKVFTALYSAYTFLTKPSELLYLSYSKADPEGRAMSPSVIISTVRRLFPDLAESREPSDGGLFDAPAPAFRRLARALRLERETGAALSAELERARDYFARDEIYSSRLAAVENFADPADGAAGALSAGVLNTNVLNTSVSELELYARCPFAYFMNCGLGVRERGLFELNAPDIGSLFHEVLSRFSSAVAESGLSWRDIDLEAGFEISVLDKCIAESAAGLKNEIMFSNARYKYAVEKIKRISRQTLKAVAAHLRLGSFEILSTEYEFGGASGDGIVFELGGGRRAVLRGRVDRVDVARGEIGEDTEGADSYVKIIDYKMGGKRFDKAEQNFGLQLQLIVYLDAICGGLNKPGSENPGSENPPGMDPALAAIKGRALPSCMFYFNVQDPIINLRGPGEVSLAAFQPEGASPEDTSPDDTSSDDTSPEDTSPDDAGRPDADKIGREILKRFRMSGVACDDMGVMRAMDSGMPGRSSVFKAVIKKDGSPGKNSDTVSREELEAMRLRARDKIREIALNIFEGNIAPFPYRKKGGSGAAKTGCDYCRYAAVCGFEALGSRRYNEIK